MFLQWKQQSCHGLYNCFRCIALDLRGYGDSERPEEVAAYKIDLLVEDVRDLMRKLGKR